MKKITSIVLALLIVSTQFAFAQQEAHIFIPTLKTDKLAYTQGETIKAEFQIDNNSDLRQSDVSITTSLVVTIDEQPIELDIKTPFKDLYLEANARRTLSFEHVVNADINGPAEFVISAYLKDGSLVGQKRNPISITNTSAKEIIIFEEAYIAVDDITYPLQAGPTVSEDSSVQIKFATTTLKNNDIVVQPKIEIYSRTELANTPIRVITPELITLASNSTYLFELPLDFDPQVYEGTLSFSSNKPVTIPSVYFRYIIEGPIGTILNANANKLSVSKDETVSVLVEYAGIPPVVENLEDFSFEDTEITPEEFEIIIPDDIDTEALTPEEFDTLMDRLTEEQFLENENQTSEQKAIIKVSLVNEKGEVIGMGTSDIDISNSGTVSLDIQVSEKAQQFSIMSEMVLEDGTVLSTYKTDLPSEKELKEAYPRESNMPSWVVALLSFIALLTVLLGGIFVKKKLYKHAIVLIIPLLATVGSYAHLQTSDAFTVEFASVANRSTYFKVNAIFSPGPSDSVSYAPGEAFKFSLNASYVACGNHSFTNLLYGPSNNWWNSDIGQLHEAFDYQVAARKSVSHKNIKNAIGDYSGPTLNRFTQWWTTTGDLPFVKYISGVPPVYVPKPGIQWHQDTEFLALYNQFLADLSTAQTGFYQENIEGLEGRELWRSSAWGSGAIRLGNETSTNYNMNPSHQYYMPTEPGFHTFYFMMQNRGNGNTKSTRVVSQEVCVRGAGVCKDETVSICPDLLGVITQDSNGVIYQDGQPTDYVIDATGKCVPPPPPTCDGTYREGQEVCINGYWHTMVCTENGWESVATERPCNQISCSADPFARIIQIGETSTGPVTFDSDIPSDVTPLSYEWRNNTTNEIVSTNSSYTLSTIGARGIYSWTIPMRLIVETEGGDTSALCSVTIQDQNYLPPPEDPGDGGDNGGGGNGGVLFRFSPGIAIQPGNTCLFETLIPQEDLDLCTFTNRVGIPYANTLTNGSLVPIGQWTLTCGTTTTTASCRSLESINEI